jgi:3-dehydroquinate dehydratase-2
MHISIINGPNLNLLGKREPELYGSRGFEDFLDELKKAYPDHELYAYQSNSEGALIDCIQEEGYQKDGIILNAGGYSHTSIALADAVSAIPIPVVEVHLTNIYSREPFRHHSTISGVAKGVIAGFGLAGYYLAIDYFTRYSP